MYIVAHCLQITQNVAFDFLVFCPTKKVCSKLTTFGIFNKRLSTQNVNVARFARTVECDFFCNFQTLWMKAIYVASRARCKVRFVQSCAQAHLFFPFFSGCLVDLESSKKCRPTGGVSSCRHFWTSSHFLSSIFPIIKEMVCPPPHSYAKEMLVVYHI